MQQFRPDIKPPQWGPPSSVQFAVIENAHRLLNAEPVACLPFWERGFRTQIFDVFGNTVSATGIYHTWDDAGYLTSSNNADGVLVSLRASVPNTAFSVFVATRRNAHVNFKDYLSAGVDTTWRNSVSASGTIGNLVSYGNGTGSAGNTAEIATGLDLGIALVLDRTDSKRWMYANGARVSVSYTPGAENLNRIRLNNRVGDDGRAIGTSIKAAYAFSSVLSLAACDRLYYEPYTLLMPVARPLYFDLGSVEPPSDITGTIAATESGSDTASIAAQLLVSGLVSASESGADTASTSGAVLITGSVAAQETGSDTAAIYGGALPVISGDVAATESGSDTASVLGQLLISGLIDASEIGSDTCAIIGIVTDTMPITLAEVGRSVALAKRNYTARL